MAPTTPKTPSSTTPKGTPRDLYLELMKRVLIGLIYQDDPQYGVRIGAFNIFQFVPKAREHGRDIPTVAHSMIGIYRMNNIQMCVEQILADNVPGDLIETGVWRGGATIFMRALLAVDNITDRTVWVADSFEGLPVPDLEHHPIDEFWMSMASKLAVSVDTVRQNFALYGLLDDQVKFLKGWFKDSLPTAPITQLALLRMDGDLYESTWDVLSALYHKVVPGGFIIIDDYDIPSCRQAIDDFRAQEGIHETIHKIDTNGVYWRRDF